MMFGRQWFPKNSQYGLTPKALQFEESLVSKRFANSRSIVISSYSENPTYWARMWRRYKHLEARTGHGISGRITYSMFGFWPDMDPCQSQIIDFFKAAEPSLAWDYHQDPRKADIVFASCYATNYTDFFESSNHAMRILFLGENIRPYYSDYDLTLSFDQFNYSGRNIYFPLWMLEVDWLDSGWYPDRKTHSLASITKAKMINTSERLPKVCYIGNNNEPLRMHLIEALRHNAIDVDCYGSQSRPVNNKIDLLSKYRVCLSPENSFYPGYTTEKPIHGFISGCRTVYWGCPDPILNIGANGAFICLDSSESVSAQVALIARALDCQVHEFSRLTSHDQATHRFQEVLSLIAKSLQQFCL